MAKCLPSQVVEFNYLRVNFEHMVTGMLKTDLLRCSSSFRGKPRFDSVIISYRGKTRLARLVFVFSCVVGRERYPTALVQILGPLSGARRRVDQDLSLYRVRMPVREKVTFIPVENIIRGAYLWEVDKGSEDFFVVDTIDGDMFLRVRQIRTAAYPPQSADKEAVPAPAARSREPADTEQMQAAPEDATWPSRPLTPLDEAASFSGSSSSNSTSEASTRSSSPV